MIKRSLLAVSIATLSAQSAVAAPFMPMDARGLAMGNTGVASAQRAHAPAYNPSLLSQAHESDDVALLFPQIGFNLADEESLVDDANDIIDNIVPDFEELFDDSSSDSFSQSVETLAEAADDLANSINDLVEANTINSANTAIADARNSNARVGSSLAQVDDKLDSLNNTTSDLNKALSSISGSPLRGRFGVGGALAFPGKKFAAAISVNADINFSGRSIITSNDQNLLAAYGQEAQGFVDQARNTNRALDTFLSNANVSNLGDVALIATQAQGVLTQTAALSNYTSDAPVQTAAGNIFIFENGGLSSEAEDPELNSQVQIKAIAVAEAALSVSREFEFFGEKVAIGLTPKLQQIETFHFVTEIDSEEDIDSDSVEDSRTSYNKVNLDLGVSYRFGGEKKWMVGFVGKNLIGEEFDVADAAIKGNTSGQTLSGGTIALNPQYRGGLAFNGDWITVAADIDLVENEPVAYEKATQYAAVGAELDIFDTLQFRAGYRTNMSGNEDEVVSVGAGFSPFGLHIDIAAMANPNKPEKEAGVALELGLYF